MSWDKIPTSIIGVKTAPEKGEAKPPRLITYRQAILEGLTTALKKDKRVFLFGEGVDDPGGVFGTTLNLHKKFGKNRSFDTPIAENTLTGLGIGAALGGLRPILVHARTDFMLTGMDQLINHAAKWKYMSGGKFSVPLVIRAIIGGGWGSASQHSQPLQALFAHTPGLKVVMPATASDAKGLLLASIAEDCPVVFIEHRWLYDRKGPVSKNPYVVPLGKGIIRKKGKDLTIAASSFMVPLSLEAADIAAKEKIDVEVIDLRTIKPLDYNLIQKSLEKTNRLVVADTGWKMCGISAEISALAANKAFGYLKAPIARVALCDAPTPASPALEKAFYPSSKDLVEAIRKIYRYGRKK
ncbi:MAG: alpha-ketoacid dehydrogenase subunit beta [Candidatus Omnitrophica bacterium]|nr:alpha-ketoacid dehydrogenase subunit beta [Candidatus Omnitrophota bacterium]